MSFACDCSCDVDDYPEFYVEEYPVARKEHKCCECGEMIKKGQKYQKAIGKWDGDFDTYKTCMTCLKIREAYCPNGSYFGGLAEAISDCLGFDYRDGDIDEDEEE